MSVICGLFALDPRHNDRLCREMLGRFPWLGPDRIATRNLGEVSFGFAQRRMLPEDDFDAQPLIGGDGRLLLTGTVRLDNREELGQTLGILPSQLKKYSDSAIILAAWERWQFGCVDRLIGDYAFAVWNNNERRLTLVRGPMAMKTLFFHHSPRGIAFATLPQALFAVPEIEKRLNREELARLAAGIHWSHETLFCGVNKVEHGHAVILDRVGWRSERIWHLERKTVPLSLDRAGEELREHLDTAVRVRLRRSHGEVGAQLSAGRDSSAVATSAALALAESGANLIALTGAPRLGFTDPTLGDTLYDEAVIAGQTAALYPNIIHRICRAEPALVTRDFDIAHHHHFRPMLNTYSSGWSNETRREAARLGVSVMLVGTRGNFSISRGGFVELGRVWDQQGPSCWLPAARSTRDNPGLDWRTIASFTFGSRMPRLLFDAALWLTGRGPAKIELPMFCGELRRHAEHFANEDRDPRPVRDDGDHIRKMIYRTDNSDQSLLAEYGIDERDPTADRRVVEFCYSLTSSQLLSANSPRPAYEAAFADRLPQVVIEGRRRGYQGADWLELYRPEYVRPALLDYARNQIVAEFIDLKAAERLFREWPTSGSGLGHNLRLFGNHLLNAVSLAGFVARNFD